MDGVVIGLSDFHIAVLTEDTVSSTTYATPEAVPGIIEANIKPKSESETLYFDDGPGEVSSALTEIEVEVNMADLPLDIQAKLLGHTVTAGVMTSKATDAAPYVAILFKSLKSNGSYRYTCLYKGRFELPEQNNKTKQDKVEFQTQTITGKFVKRQSDNAWRKIADEDATGYLAATGEGWFTSVT